MLAGIIGRKLGMTQVFRDNGQVESATAIEAGPCVITQVKTAAKEGYTAIQLGFSNTKRLTSPEKGHLKGVGELRYLREFRVKDTEDLKVGDKVDAGLFKVGDVINVTGTSKGKGFAGVVKRHHFRGGPKTHGQSDRTRHPGSISSTTTPGRVWKGTRMAGHMGSDRITVRNLEVCQVDTEHNLLLVKGAVPGYKNELLLIRKAGKEK
ncbi:MAG: 50S ribosomal protein L3 [Chloroflexota bacterium]